MKTYQIAPGRSQQFHHEAPPVAFTYKLDSPRFKKLTEHREFKRVQDMSNSPQPSGLEQKILLGIQQFAEAARLPSATLKLVWYWSALETILKKEIEGSNITRLKHRINQLLGKQVSDWIGPLYRKRGKPVHFGVRNRMGAELVTSLDLQQVKLFAYLGIVQVVAKVSSEVDHHKFLDAIDTIKLA